jgi:hypothetical protein
VAKSRDIGKKNDADTARKKAAIEQELTRSAPRAREIIDGMVQRGQESAKAREAIDHYTAIRDNQIPPSWSPKSKPRKKQKRPVGKPPEYEVERIRAVARNYLKDVGIPKTLTLFKEKVEDQLVELRIAVPGHTRFGELLSPIWRAAQRRKRQV